MTQVLVDTFFESDSSTACYIVSCKASKEAAIIDSVLDYNHNSGTTSTKFADKLLTHVREHQLNIKYVLETHAHADHITAAPYLKKQLGGSPATAIGELITGVQKTFQHIYNTPDWRTDGSQWDRLLTDGDRLELGNHTIEALWTPGHTPDHLSYLIRDDCIFTGDSLFMPDQGTARCDFPNGSSEQLWQSIQKIFSLIPTTRVFVGHDYAPGGRPHAFETTIEQQRKANVHVKEGTVKADFLATRESRDKTLDHPKLLIPALQVNLLAGYFPKPEDNDGVYLRFPINVLKPAANTGVFSLE